MQSGGVDTRYLHARFALVNPDANYITCTFSGFALEFCRYIEHNWELLVRDIEKGMIDQSIEMPDDVRTSVEEKITPDSRRAEELREIFKGGFDEPFVPKVWPQLSNVRAGATGSFKGYTEILQSRYLGPDIRMFKRGVTASEGCFSQAIDFDSCDSLLIPNMVFMEFIPEDSENADEPHLLTIDQLEVGKKYELVITNMVGLYRYRMKDVFLVTGKHNNCPLVEYQYRSDKTVSLMGEKTTELAVRTAALQTAKECGFVLVDCTMYPDPEEMCYTYLFEAEHIPNDLTFDAVRDCLQANVAKVNPSMGEKMQNGICKPVKLLFAQPETFFLYRDMAQMRGLSAAQIKPVTVVTTEMQRKFFFSLTEDFEALKSQAN